MRREMKKIVQSAANVVHLHIDTSKWDHALITFSALGAAGSAIVLAPTARDDTNFAGAPAAPAANASVHIGVGPGCTVPVPLPEVMTVGMSAAGGQVSITVELVRYVMEEDDAMARSLMDHRKLLEAIVSKLEDVVIELRSLPRK